MGTWSPERDVTLAELWAKGLTSLAIAEQMHLSKNQVIGRAHRLGLTARTNPVRKRRPSATDTTPKPPKILNGINRPHVDVTGFTGKATSRCRWPLADWLKRVRAHENPFCDAPAQPSSSWCTVHRKRVYQRGTGTL